jgi:hypothetical protein
MSSMADGDNDSDVARAAELADEEDYDLLTYTEAGLRLREEIAKETALLAASPTADRSRLDALTEALERNSRRAVNDQNFEKFFGYPASARRVGAQ